MRILFADDNDITLYSFRKELLDRLIIDKHDICLVGNFTNKVTNEYSDKVKIVNINLDLKSINISSNLRIKREYKNIIARFNPDVILSFTIKPNIYCNYYKNNAYSIANITGLGTAFNKKGILKSIVIHLYRKSFKNVNKIMFQNEEIKNTFIKAKIKINDYDLIPGSGVNESRFSLLDLDEHDNIRFLYPSRFIAEKGFNLLLKAIPTILSKYPHAHFTFLGSGNNKSEKLMSKYSNLYPKNIECIDFTNDIYEYYRKADFIVSPSYYHEGVSNVLLESLACGRPIITTNDNSGCKELLIENKTGYGCSSKDLCSLIIALEKACATKKEKIISMGQAGRKLVIEKFKRNSTIKKYLDSINTHHMNNI